MVITQSNFKHKNLLGNMRRRAVGSVKHCEKRLPLKQGSFSERGLKKITQIVKDFSCKFDDQLSQNFHRFAILYLDTTREKTIL